MKKAPKDCCSASGRRLMRAAERSAEAASILLRENITESFGINREALVAILRASIEALYYDAQGKLRDRPLREPLEDVFALQTVPQMRYAVTSLAERIGPSRRFFMVTPDPAAPQLSLSPVAERDAEGVRELKGRSEEHTSELQSLMRISYAVFCL